MRRIYRIVFFLPLLLAACGGGSSDQSLPPIATEPPRIISVSIVPEIASTADDLSVDINLQTPAEHQVRYTYEWTVNNSTYTGSTLPSKYFRKNQYVSVEVTATNSEGVSSRSDNIFIGEVVSNVEVNFPEFVEYTDGLNIALLNNVGSNFQGKVIYGPKGMRVTSDGRLIWMPNEIMLGTTLNVRFAVSFNNGDGNKVVAHQIQLVDANRKLVDGLITDVPNRTNFFNLIDTDNNGFNEILLTPGNLLSAHEFEDGKMTQKWMYPFQLNKSEDIKDYKVVAKENVIVKDVTADNIAEILITTENGVLVLDGATREIQGTITHEQYESFRGGHIEDIDDDGELELIVYATDLGTFTLRIIILDVNTGDLEWTSPVLATSNVHREKAFLIANVDLDDSLEIITPSGYVYDGVTKEEELYREEGFGTGNFFLVAGDVLGKGYSQIVIHGLNLDVTADTLNFYDAVLKKLSTQSVVSEFENSFSDYVVADVLGNGRQQLVASTTAFANRKIVIYDYIKSTDSFDITSTVVVGASEILKTGDINNDGKSDIFAASSTFSSNPSNTIYSFVNGELATLWHSNTMPGVEAPFKLIDVVEDINGVKIEALANGYGYDLVGQEEGTRILTRSNFARETSSIATSTAVGDLLNSVKSYAVDFDNDGTNEYVNCGSVGNSFFSIELINHESESLWRNSMSRLSCESFIFHDVNKDGYLDIAFGASLAGVFVYDMKNNALLQEEADFRFETVDSYLDSSNIVNIISSTTSLGTLEKYQFNSSGKLVRVFDGEGTTTNRSSDRSSFLFSDLDLDGNLEIFNFRSRANLFSYIRTFDESMNFVREVQMPLQVRALSFDKQNGVKSKNVIFGYRDSALGSPRTIVGSYDIDENEVIWEYDKFLIGSVLDRSGLYVTNDSRLIITTEYAIYTSH